MPAPPPDMMTPKPVLDRLTDWVASGEPCCHPRFGDAEFNSLRNRRGGKRTQGRFFGDSLGKRLGQMLAEVAAQHPDYGNVLIGCSRTPGLHEWLRNQGLHNQLPICLASALMEGIESLATLRLLQVIKESPMPKVLVGNRLLQRATGGLRCEFVPIPFREAWLAYDDIKAACERHASRPTLFLVCAGMMAAVLQWDLWKQFPQCASIDLGHILDLACGRRSRHWTRVPNAKRTTYRKRYVSLIRKR